MSLLVINDCHIDEIAVFREHVSVFAEHMFLEVHFQPMKFDQMQQIIFEQVAEAYGDTCPFLLSVYTDYFFLMNEYF